MSDDGPRHRFLLPVNFQNGSEVRLTAEQSNQVARVLRMGSGDRIALFDGAGNECVAELQEVSPRSVVAVVNQTRQRPPPLPWSAVLYVPLIRPQRFEWALEKATELGATALVPLLTERVTHGSSNVSGEKRGRWQRLIRESVEQCESAYLPRLGDVSTLSKALHEPAALRLFAWENGADSGRVTVAQVLGGLSHAASGTIALFVGPEGGFTDAEAAAACDAGCAMITLGPNTLRTETAAVVLLSALVQAAIERPGATTSGDPIRGERV